MKKTLLVSAVAMAVSGNAMAAEMYGNIRLGLQTYVAPSADPVGGVGQVELGVDELDVRSGKLVLGSKGSSDLGNGMTVSYGLEMEHDAADTKQSGWANDKSWVGLSGGFGSVKAGRAGDLAGYTCGGTDLLTHGTAEACSLGHNTEFDNAIMYTGGAGALEFGLVYTADGSAADDDTMIGVKYSGNNWSVGFTSWDNNCLAGEVAETGCTLGTATTQTQIGGTYQLGDIGLGITVGDNDAATDSGGVDFGLYMPLGAGNLAVVISSLDADTKIKSSVSDGSSFDIEYNVPVGSDAYWGVELNSKDNWDEDRIIGFLGTNF